MNKTWRERLQETETATDEMVIQASSWQTCAVGEQHEKYPEVVVHKSGDECGKVGCHPKDEVLRDLSQKFYDYLKDGKDGHEYWS